MSTPCARAMDPPESGMRTVYHFAGGINVGRCHSVVIIYFLLGVRARQVLSLHLPLHYIATAAFWWLASKDRCLKACPCWLLSHIAVWLQQCAAVKAFYPACRPRHRRASGNTLAHVVGWTLRLFQGAEIGSLFLVLFRSRTYKNIQNELVP